MRSAPHALALSGGTFAGQPDQPKPEQDALFEHKERRFCATHEGFDAHCAVRIAACDATKAESGSCATALAHPLRSSDSNSSTTAASPTA